jgi:4-amino-4-deoxy-L-arabinose transferase-like glycosyltransferase
LTLRRLTYALLALLLIIYLILAYRYASQTPDWQIPDEPAHYNYIRQIVDDGRIPVIQVGDWNTDYQTNLIRSGFDPQFTQDIQRVQYEDHQPPLYYLLAAPIYALTDGDLLTLRLLSVFLGMGVVICTFFVMIRLFPEKPTLALTATGFVAFIPQHLAMLGGVNNDSLAELLVGVTLLAVIRYLQMDNPRLRDAALIGVLVGICFLTKATIYFMAGIVGIAILMRWRRDHWPKSVASRQIAAFAIPALLLGSVWWVHNLDVYGGTDFLGLQRHDIVAGGQLQTRDYIEDDLKGDIVQYLRWFFVTTFHSFWGQFGWMAQPMSTRIYQGILLAMGLTLTGFAITFRREGWPKSLTHPQREALLLFALMIVLVFAAFVFYNLSFVQFQGRYLYPALIPLGFVVAIGFSGWASLWRLQWATVPAVMLLAVLAWYALDTFIVPVFPNH